MNHENCNDCNGPAHEDEGYHMEGRLLCLGCFDEAITMAVIASEVSDTPVHALNLAPMMHALSGGAA